MTAFLYLLTLCLPLGTVLLIFAMRYAASAIASRARLANDGAYQALAEKAAAAQVQTQDSLAAIQAELARLSASLVAVETILKQVE